MTGPGAGRPGAGRRGAGRPGPGRLGAGLALGWLTISTAAVVVRFGAPLHPLVIAAGRVAVSALAWGAIVLWKRPASAALEPGERVAPRVLLSGLLLGAHFAMWITSLTETSVTHAAVLVSLTPLFGGVFGLMLGDRVHLGRLGAGMVIAVAGAALFQVGGGHGGGQPPTLHGDLLAVGAGAASALYLTVNRSLRGRVDLGKLLLCVNGIGSLSIAVCFALAVGAAWWPDGAQPERQGLAILWLGLGPGLVGHGLLNWAARHLAVHLVSVAVLLEPIGASVLAYLVLGETVGPYEVLGGALLLAGAAVVSWSPSGARD